MTTGLFTACVGGFSPDLTDDNDKVDSGIVDVIGDNNLSVDKEDKEEVSFPQNAGENGIFTFKYLGYVYYGTYPQTIAHKKAVKEMSETTDSTGYYYSTYDDSHYEKITSAMRRLFFHNFSVVSHRFGRTVTTFARRASCRREYGSADA